MTSTTVDVFPCLFSPWARVVSSLNKLTPPPSTPTESGPCPFGFERPTAFPFLALRPGPPVAAVRSEGNRLPFRVFLPTALAKGFFRYLHTSSC